jgi:ethanolamine utilization protein EutA
MTRGAVVYFLRISCHVFDIRKLMTAVKACERRVSMALARPRRQLAGSSLHPGCRQPVRLDWGWASAPRVPLWVPPLVPRELRLSVAERVFVNGEVLSHDHGGDHHDHRHSHGLPAVDGDLGRGTERVELVSAGIDIGSATCQVVFSRLVLVRRGRVLSSRYELQSRERMYTSALGLTPYLPSGDIDTASVDTLMAEAFREAGLSSEDVDAGVVILTGEAARRRNAPGLAEMVARRRGGFVCAAAGHSLEGELAAFGSGAVDLAREEGSRILNIDVGGGTTKISLAGPEGLQSTFAVHVGARLVAFDGDGRIVRLETQGAELAHAAGVDWRIGHLAADDEMDRVARYFLRVVESFLPKGDMADRASFSRHLLTPAPDIPDSVDEIVVSGGVASFLSGAPVAWSSDLGERMARELLEWLDSGRSGPRYRVVGPDATALGAAEHTVQVSGNTIYVSDEAGLPLRNLHVIRPRLALPEEVSAAEVAQSMREGAEDVRRAKRTGGVIFAFAWSGSPRFARVSAFARGLAEAAGSLLDPGEPLCLLFDSDVANLVGQLISENVGGSRPVISIDGIDLTEYDFVDLGRVLRPSGAMPVTIKTLVFG